MPLDPEHIDNLMDEAHERLREIDAEMGAIRERGRSFQSDRDIDATSRLDHERTQIQHGIRNVLNSEHAPVGYLEHYNQKYMTPAQPAAAQPEGGSGFIDWMKNVGSNIGTGISKTADYAIKNPISALKHIEQGKNELVSAPMRAIESLVGGPRWLRGGMDRQKQEVAAYDKSVGVDSRDTGPVVAENIGQILVPLPLPKALAPKGNLLGDFTKGALYGGGIHAIERKSNDEPVLDEGLGTTAAISGAISALLGRFAPKSPAGSTGSSGSVNGGTPPSTAPPNAGGAVDNIDASIVRTETGPLKALPPPMKQLTNQPAMEMPGPPAQLQAPGPKPVSPFRDLMESIKAKTATGEPLNSREQGFALWMQRNKGVPPPNVSGMREEINVQTRPVQAQTAPPNADPASTPMQQLLRKQPTPVAAPVPEAAPVVEQTVNKPTPMTPKQVKAIPPDKIIDVVKQQEASAAQAADDAVLRDVISKKIRANDVPVKPKKGEAPIAAVQGEVGATPVSSVAPPRVAQLSQPQVDGPPPQKPAAPIQPAVTERKSALSSATAKPEPKNVRLDDFVREQGYKVREFEPFPGQKAYDIKDPITGDTIARGDREQLVNALNSRNEGKGFKLYSGVDPTPLWQKLKQAIKGVPDDVEVKNSPHREKFFNMVTREAGLETSDFAFRKNATGKKAVEHVLDFEDAKLTRVNDLFHAPQKDGTYKPTKALDYFAASAQDKQVVNDVLVVGDKMGRVFTPEQLVKNGLTTEQARMYEGVREMLDKSRDWMGDLGKEIGRLKGYIPRVWHGELELFVDGKKYVPTKNDRVLGSSFSTLHEAGPTMWKLKQENPGAKIEARFFTDPNYLGHRGIRDAKEIGSLKAKLDKMGTLTKEQMDELFHKSKSYKDFARHLFERGDAQGYETEGLDKVLYSYVHQAAKAVEGRKLRDAVETLLKNEGTNLTEPQTKYLENYVARVLGKPTWDKLYIDKVIRQTVLGKYLDPVQLGGGIKTAKDFITYTKLGFGNVSWALVNIDSLSRHIWPALQRESKGLTDRGILGVHSGEAYVGRAIKEFFKNKGLRQKLAHNNVIDIQQMSEIHPSVQAHIGKWTAADAIMILGKSTEEFVRGVGAIARYRMALDQGLADADAMRVASRFVAETVGRYTTAGKPQAFTGLVGSSVGMFKTYPVVMLQNMVKAFESKDAGVISRYILASLAAGGVIGAIPGSEEIDNLATRATGTSPIQWGLENLGDGVMTGLASVAPGGAAVDLSRKAGLPDVFPNSTKDWLGPVWNTYGQVIADVMNGEHEEAIKDLLPTSVKNALAVSQKQGKVVGRYDKPLVELEPGTVPRLVRGLGFQSPKETRALRDYEYLNTLRDSNEGELRNLTRKVYQQTATPEEQRRFHELGGTNRRLKAEGQRETLTLRQRQERQLPKLLRGQRDAQ